MTSMRQEASSRDPTTEPSVPPERWTRRRLVTVLAACHIIGLVAVGAAGGGTVAVAMRSAAIVGVGGALWSIARSLPSSRARVRRLLLAAVLTATTTAAAVIAITHLSRVGVRSLGASVAAASGTALIGGLAGGAWKRTRTWRRLAGVPLVMALGCFVVFPVAIAWYATTQPPAELGRRHPRDLGLIAEDVVFRTEDGVELSGWYLPSRTGAAVVLLHGASSSRTSVLDHGAALHASGYGVLMFDARGHGRSGGSPMDLGWYGDLDVRAAIDHLLARPEVSADRIALVGLSMGGEEAIGAAASDTRVRAVVAEGASNRTYEDRDDWLPHGWNGMLQRTMDRLAFALTDLVSPASSPMSLREAVAATAPRPVLLIAGEGELTAARSIQRGSPSTVTIWSSHVGHTRAFAELPDEWRDRVIAFLDDALA